MNLHCSGTIGQTLSRGIQARRLIVFRAHMCVRGGTVNGADVPTGHLHLFDYGA